MKEAALREVKEETGIYNIQIVRGLASYSYIHERYPSEHVEKTVYYFLMRLQSGTDPGLKVDISHKDVAWFSLEDIRNLNIYYADARDVIQKATKLLEEQGFDGGRYVDSSSGDFA